MEFKCREERPVVNSGKHPAGYLDGTDAARRDRDELQCVSTVRSVCEEWPSHRHWHTTVKMESAMIVECLFDGGVRLTDLFDFRRSNWC